MKIYQLLTLLLSPIVGGYYPELSLINELTVLFRFDHHIYLLDASAEANRYINAKGSTPQSLFVFRSEDNVTDELDNVEIVNSMNPLMIVVPESEQFEENSTIIRLMKNVQRRQMMPMKIGVFYSQYSYEDLRSFFEWCKDNLIVDIFAATTYSSSCLVECSMNIFSYNPFAEFDVINVTGGREMTKWDDVFVSQKSNFQQHQLHFGRPPQSLGDYEFWSGVLRLMNATWTVVKHNYTDDREALKNGIDIFPEKGIQTEVVHFNVYPIRFTDYLIIVPEALPYAEFSAILLNATSGELCGYSFASIVAAILVLSILRHVKRKKVSILQSVVDVFNLLLNDNGGVRYNQMCRSETFIVVPLTFVGLIVTNGILSMLQSHLTRPLLQPQIINSVKDLHASLFPVLVPPDPVVKDFWKDEVIERLSYLSEGKDWSRKVIVEEESGLYLATFNRTSSFYVHFDTLEIIMGVQKHMKLKVYHNPDIKISHVLYGFLLSDKFIFFERFNDIVQRMKSAGLYDLRYRQFLSSAESVMVEQHRRDHTEETPSIEFPILIVYGWLAALIVFILEIIWNFVSRWRKIRRTHSG